MDLTELQSSFDIKSKEMEKLKNEKNIVVKQYRQLKAKNEKDVSGFSQGAMADSLETDPRVSIYTYVVILYHTYSN